MSIESSGKQKKQKNQPPTIQSMVLLETKNTIQQNPKIDNLPLLSSTASQHCKMDKNQ